MSDTTRPDLEQSKASYLEHLALKNHSPLTLRQIEHHLRFFLGWLTGRGIVDIGKVDMEVFEGYKAYLTTGYATRRGARLSVGAMQTRLYSIHKWFEWMRRKGVVFSNPIAGVKIPRSVKQLPRGVLRQDEIRKVMEQPDLKTALGYRDRTMMEVLYATGVRASELAALRIADIDVKKKIIRVRRGKGGSQRFAPLSTPSCRFLERYLEEVRPELVQGMMPRGRRWLEKAGTGVDFVFLSAYGGPLAARWIGCVMRRYLKEAGITRPISPVHGFRHSVATHLLEDGMDVRYVQVLLGHKDIRSTQIYTHVERATLQRFLKAHHPRELAREDVIPFKDAEREQNAIAA